MAFWDLSHQDIFPCLKPNIITDYGLQGVLRGNPLCLLRSLISLVLNMGDTLKEWAKLAHSEE